MKVLLVITVALFSLASPSVADDKRAVAHFDRYLSQCSENEIRCVWFLNDSVRIGMIMTIDLKDSKVHTVRYVYNHAYQSAENRKLSHSQITTLKSILTKMPKTASSGDRLKTLYISYKRDSKVVVSKYHRDNIPPLIERIYDIGGGYLDYKKQSEPVPPDGE